MLRQSRMIAILIAALSCSTTPSFGQDSFFKGKTMRIVVGGPPGGGFDTYARMIARVMPKHIPGAPTIIVENMPGAGMMIAANHVYKVSKPDGLTIGHFTGSQTISQVLNRPGVEFDMRKFYYLGAPTADHFSCAFTKASGITSADSWLKLKRPAKMGAVGPGNLTDNTLRVLSTSTDLPIQLISGYKGTAPVRLAMELARSMDLVGVGTRSNPPGREPSTQVRASSCCKPPRKRIPICQRCRWRSISARIKTPSR